MSMVFSQDELVRGPSIFLVKRERIIGGRRRRRRMKNLHCVCENRDLEVQVSPFFYLFLLDQQPA